MVIQREEFNVKESQRYNVSVLINYHQVLERMTSSDIISTIDFWLYKKKQGEITYTEEELTV